MSAENSVDVKNVDVQQTVSVELVADFVSKFFKNLGMKVIIDSYPYMRNTDVTVYNPEVVVGRGSTTETEIKKHGWFRKSKITTVAHFEKYKTELKAVCYREYDSNGIHVNIHVPVDSSLVLFDFVEEFISFFRQNSTQTNTVVFHNELSLPPIKKYVSEGTTCDPR